MELKQFIADALNAQPQAAALGARINPVKGGVAAQALGTAGGAAPVNVEFTVGLSVTEGTGSKGGIGVIAGVFALGSRGESNAAKASTTHISFSVPLTLPTGR